MKFKVQAEIVTTNVTEIEVEALNESDAKVEAARILNGPDQPPNLIWWNTQADQKNALWVGVKAEPS